VRRDKGVTDLMRKRRASRAFKDARAVLFEKLASFPNDAIAQFGRNNGVQIYTRELAAGAGDQVTLFSHRFTAR